MPVSVLCYWRHHQTPTREGFCQAMNGILNDSPTVQVLGEDSWGAQIHLQLSCITPHGNPSPPCPNMGLSEHGHPVFPHFSVFFGSIIFAVPIQ